MSDLPSRIDIQEEGPREGFQIEPGPIATARKIELIDALTETGLKKIQVASYVNPKRVPGWADADEVVKGFKRKEGVAHHALWLNEKGLRRAIAADDIYMFGSISTTTSETFMGMNTNRGFKENVGVQRNQIAMYQEHGIPVTRASIMTAWGCNFEGDIPPTRVVKQLEELLDLEAETGIDIDIISLADTVGWATPKSVKEVVGAVRNRWPDKRICLHLHDTRGCGIANVYAGLEMGVDLYDSSVAGLGGCPFAGHKGAAGNVTTEDIVFMCDEMGVETGVDLEALIECARLAEDIVGHDLPGKVMRGGALSALRRDAKAQAAHA